MIAQFATSERAAEQHLRPFLPHRDLSDLAALVEAAFGEELVATGSHMVEDLRQMALWGSAWRIAPALGAMFGGYVWVEDGRVVGNVSLAQEGRHGSWTLSNVAVLPAYRRRGIASRLTDAAIEHARRHEGRRILLEVRRDNAVAQGIYLRRGFRIYDTVDDLSIAPGRWPVVANTQMTGIRAVRTGDGPALYRLALACTPDAVQRCVPLRAGDWQRGWADGWRATWRLLLQNEQRIEMVASEGRDVVAYGAMRVRLGGGQHAVALLVHPDMRGRWERPIAEALIARLRYAPRLRIRCQVALAHPQAIDALHALGFETHRTLDDMCLLLDRPATH